LHPECLELFNAAPFRRVDEDEPFKIEIESPQGLLESLTDDPLKIDRPGPLPQAPGKPEWAARPPGGTY
jgi:hypothetical protein